MHYLSSTTGDGSPWGDLAMIVLDPVPPASALMVQEVFFPTCPLLVKDAM